MTWDTPTILKRSTLQYNSKEHSTTFTHVPYLDRIVWWTMLLKPLIDQWNIDCASSPTRPQVEWTWCPKESNTLSNNTTIPYIIPSISEATLQWAFLVCLVASITCIDASRCHQMHSKSLIHCIPNMDATQPWRLSVCKQTPSHWCVQYQKQNNM